MNDLDVVLDTYRELFDKLQVMMARRRRKWLRKIKERRPDIYVLNKFGAWGLEDAEKLRRFRERS